MDDAICLDCGGVPFERCCDGCLDGEHQGCGDDNQQAIIAAVAACLIALED